MQQIAALAGQAAQAIIVAGYLAQLEYRRADELGRIGLAQMLERNRNGFGIALEARQQGDQGLGRGRADIVGIRRSDLRPKMRDGVVYVLAEQGSQVNSVTFEAILERRIAAELEHR